MIPEDESKRISMETTDTIRQRLAYDIAPDDLLVSEPVALGLHRASEDVVAAEMMAAHVRRSGVGPITPLVNVMARLSSEIINGSILLRQKKTDSKTAGLITPEQVFTATRAILATLVDLGIVHIPHPENGEDEDE